MNNNFETWWDKEFASLARELNLKLDDEYKIVASMAWNYQQKTIDELNAKLDNIEGYVNV